MKRLFLCLLTLSCVNSVKPSHFFESRSELCREMWQDIKTMVTVHPYATGVVTASFLYFIFLYTRDADAFTPCVEGVPHYTKDNLQMHVCIPGKVKRPVNFSKKYTNSEREL